MRRRGLLAALAILPAAMLPVAARAEAALPVPESLALELARALAAGRPLVVMASLDGCPYCKAVRESFLVPLWRDTGQPIVQLDMGSPRAVRDFTGQATTHAALLRAWGIAVAPTVLFFGRGGREVAPRLVGASIPDFYGAYLDDRLATAGRHLD